MLALWRDWAGSPPRHSQRIAASLGLFAGHPAGFSVDGNTAFSFLPAPRLNAPLRRWQPHRGANGATVLFHGRIDNPLELADLLCTRETDPAALYGAAVARWGDSADFHIIGNYCAVVAAKDTLRLARSPWDAPPLHHCHFDGQSVVSSVPRVLLSAGLPERLDRTRLADNLYFNLLERTRGWYEGAHRVGYGSVMNLTADGAIRSHSFYDPLASGPVRFKRDEDYVEAANALLAEATTKALAGAKHPGIMLSGGLDSPLLAAEVLRQLPQEARLPSFTFAPGDSWDGVVPDGLMGDERPFVREFAAMHPRLSPHFTQNPGAEFDSRWPELFTAMGGAPNHLCNFYVYHGVWAGAHAQGCDVLLTADFGNQTYSNDARWAYVELLRNGQWRELALALRHRPGDSRSMAHKLVALSLVRLLPHPLRRAIRQRRHPARTQMNALISMLTSAEQASAHARAQAAGAVIEHEHVATQAESVRLEYHWRDSEGAEVQQGFEQLYGLRQIDVPTYRPLAEFCAGLPTRQFLHHGQYRWLARRMAQGKLPEKQRLNHRIGWHNVDWYARMTPRIAEFRGEIARIAANPEISGLIDPQRMAAALEDWPVHTVYDPEDWMPRAAGLTRGLLTARFIQHTSGRNAP